MSRKKETKKTKKSTNNVKSNFKSKKNSDFNHFSKSKKSSSLKLNPKKSSDSKNRMIDKKDNIFIKVDDASYDATYLALKYKLPYQFSKKVLLEADEYLSDMENVDLEPDRIALFDKDIVTIDGEDAKDFDDAINIDKTEKGYNIGVHIADVSHFVSKGSMLDKSALERGNSVYLIDTVIPMFPEKLSNGLCSLNENVVRFTLSAFISIDFKGNVIDSSFSKTAIRSKKRLTYNYAQDVIDHKVDDVEEWLVTLLKTADEAKEILLKKRVEDGSLNFELDEKAIIVDKKSEPTIFKTVQRKETHRIVEEFMLLANRVVAKYLSGNTTAIYRVHENPDDEKLQNFARVAYNRGYHLKKDKHGVFDFNSLFEEIKGKDDEKLLITLLLRCMKQAIYDTNNIGHFGLSFTHYTHFTSPIRRYTDLETHRILKRLLSGGKSLSTADVARISKMSVHCSETERAAISAERELAKIKAARYLKNHIGEIYDGIISGVTSFGIFVEINNMGIEGLIRYQDITNSHYTYYEEEQYALSKDKKHSFTLGDKIKIVVYKINIERLFIDFKLSD